MPYIKKERRREILVAGTVSLPETAGELNFLVTTLLLDYVTKHGIGYQTFNDVMGVLECAKQEFYRRKVAPYEDIKVKENGDVY
jgi:hypothetical protein